MRKCRDKCRESAIACLFKLVHICAYAAFAPSETDELKKEERSTVQRKAVQKEHISRGIASIDAASIDAASCDVTSCDALLRSAAPRDVRRAHHGA